MDEQDNQEELRKEKAKLKTISFWDYFSSLVDILKLNNKTIQKVTFSSKVLMDIFRHDSSCLDQMISALDEGNQNNLLVIFNVKQVFQGFVKTLKQVKSLVEGTSRWVQAQSFNQKKIKNVHKQKIINFQKNCCHYCEQILQQVRVNELATQLNLSKRARFDNIQKMLKEDLYDEQPFKFNVNYSVRTKYPQAENYISQALAQQDKRLSQVQNYLKEYQIQTKNIKEDFDLSSIQNIIDDFIKRTKETLSRSHKVKYDDILNEFKDRLNVYSLQIQQKYLNKSGAHNKDGLTDIFSKQKRLVIKVKPKQNDINGKKTVFLQQSQFYQLINKKQKQISKKFAQIQQLNLQKEKYKAICSRLQKQLSAALEKHIILKNASRKDLYSSVKDQNSSQMFDVQTQIDQTQIIVVFNISQNPSQAIQKVTNLAREKNKIFMSTNNFENFKNVSIKALDMSLTFPLRQCQCIEPCLNQKITEAQKKNAETQYQNQNGIFQNCQRNQLLSNQRSRSKKKKKTKIQVRQNQRNSKDFSGFTSLTNETNSPNILQASYIKSVQESCQQKIGDKSQNETNKKTSQTFQSQLMKNWQKDKKPLPLAKKSMKQISSNSSKRDANSNNLYKKNKQPTKKQDYNLKHNLTELSCIEEKKDQHLSLTKKNAAKQNLSNLQNKQNLKQNQQLMQYILQKGESCSLQEHRFLLNKNQRPMKRQLVVKKPLDKNLSFLQAIEHKQIQQLSKLKQLKTNLPAFQKNTDKQYKNHRRYNTETSDLNQNASFYKVSKKKNAIKKQIFFNISDLQIFGGISESFSYQKMSSQSVLNKLLSAQRQQQKFQQNGKQKQFLQEAQTKQISRIYHYIMALKQFRNALYWNILSFLLKLYETVEQNKVVVEQQQQIILKQKLQNLFAFHKRLCRSTVCRHLQLFFNKIGFQSKIYQKADSSCVSKYT